MNNCARCDKIIEDQEGVMFLSPGNISELVPDVEGGWLEIAICMDCLTTLSKSEQITLCMHENGYDEDIILTQPWKKDE